MHPVICEIFGLKIYTYGLMVAIAFAVCSLLAINGSEKYSIKKNIIVDAMMVIFMAGLVGARLLYVIQNIDIFIKNPIEIFDIRSGGMAIQGSMVLVFFSGIIFASKKKISFLRLADYFAPYVALGQGIGRIGCFFNGCCYGREDLIIPVQLLDAGILFLMFLLLYFKRQRPHEDGMIIFQYFLFYSLCRFFVEFLRMDMPKELLGLNFAQFISLGVIGSLGVWWFIRRK
ncbi:MAG: prolipoprotein diacylglyceryl transferase [Candidatus Omnitrophica bacterium]|nr:prolipoprotein diacylglyceryl transferase [Candidatus Omnitrophota bacterium]